MIACIASNVMGSVWYLDSDALFHMTVCRDIFNDLEEKYIQMHIDLGDDRRYSSIRISTILTFKRELGSPLLLKDVMFVQVLQKNLISIAFLEDYGYDVIFIKGKEFMRHIATRKVN